MNQQPQQWHATNQNGERKTFKATDSAEARHWVINHLDLSQNWTIGRVKEQETNNRQTETKN